MHDNHNLIDHSQNLLAGDADHVNVNLGAAVGAGTGSVTGVSGDGFGMDNGGFDSAFDGQSLRGFGGDNFNNFDNGNFNNFDFDNGHRFGGSRGIPRVNPVQQIQTSQHVVPAQPIEPVAPVHHPKTAPAIHHAQPFGI